MSSNLQVMPESQPPSSSSKTTYTYYHAGPLFTIADLHTNTLLSRTIQSLSHSKFSPILPQDLEQRGAVTPHSIRDTDIRALLSCDLALFTYDGAELDSGTVVEFCIAKMADIPAVILRSDFRGAGDQKGGESWNLMSSFWPRTRGVCVDAMGEYKMAGGGGGGRVIEETARRVVSAMEEAVMLEPRMPRELRESVYRWIVLMPGFAEGEDEEDMKRSLALLAGKEAKGLF